MNWIKIGLIVYFVIAVIISFFSMRLFLKNDCNYRKTLKILNKLPDFAYFIIVSIVADLLALFWGFALIGIIAIGIIKKNKK